MKKLLSLVTLLLSITMLTPASVHAEAKDLLYLSDALTMISEVTGYSPDATCCENDEYGILTFHFANGDVRTSNHHKHKNGKILVDRQEFYFLMEEVNTGAFNYTWHPTNSNIIFVNRGGIILPGIEMPFEFGYCNYNNAYILSYNANRILINNDDLFFFTRDGVEEIGIPSKFFAEVYYAWQRAEFKYFEEHPEELQSENYTFLKKAMNKYNFLSLHEIFERVWEESIYGYGFLSFTVTFTEANSVLLEATIDDIRVDYHILQLDEWYIDDNGNILICNDAVEAMISDPTNPS